MRILCCVEIAAYGDGERASFSRYTVPVCVLDTCAVVTVHKAHVMHEEICVGISVVEYCCWVYICTADVLEFLIQSFYCSLGRYFIFLS